MMKALQAVYTSAPKGLLPGTSGYCTVLSTRGLDRALLEYLEKLSAYRVIDTGDHGKLALTQQNYEMLCALNPPNHSYVRFDYRGKPVHVMLRTSLAGFDYSSRIRKLTHFLVLDPTSQNPANNTAWIMSQERVFVRDWAADPQELDKPKEITVPGAPPLQFHEWTKSGDAGWAGLLAESVTKRTQQKMLVIYDQSMDPLRLVSEALSLVPDQQRARVTFATNFIKNIPPSVDCQWRMVLKGTPDSIELPQRNDHLTIDLTDPSQRPGSSPFVDAARKGVPMAGLAQPAPIHANIPPTNGAAMEVPPLVNTSPDRYATSQNPPQIAERPTHPANDRMPAWLISLISVLSTLLVVLIISGTVYLNLPPNKSSDQQGSGNGDLSNTLKEGGGDKPGPSTGKKDDDKTDNGESDDDKADDNVDTGKKDDDKTDNGESDDDKTDDNVDTGKKGDDRTDDGESDVDKTDDGKSDDGKRDDGKMDDSKSDDDIADDGKSEDKSDEVQSEDSGKPTKKKGGDKGSSRDGVNTAPRDAKGDDSRGKKIDTD